MPGTPIRRELVVQRGSRAARMTAQLSPHLTDDAGVPLGILGWFDCPDDLELARELFAGGVAWLHDRGARRIVGPMDGDTWHRYRVNVGPFDRPPFPLEPSNPPYWRALWEEAGFTCVESYSSKLVSDLSAMVQHFAASAERAAEAGVTIRPLRRERLRDELALVHAISSEIFAEAPFYAPIELADFLALYDGIERLLDPELVVFAVDPDGREIGFLFAYAAQETVHFKTLGVRAAWRRTGVSGALAHHGYSTARRMGLRHANHALMRDDNRSQSMDAGLGTVFRRYLLYQWPSAPSA